MPQIVTPEFAEWLYSPDIDYDRPFSPGDTWDAVADWPNRKAMKLAHDCFTAFAAGNLTAAKEYLRRAVAVEAQKQNSIWKKDLFPPRATKHSEQGAPLPMSDEQTAIAENADHAEPLARITPVGVVRIQIPGSQGIALGFQIALGFFLFWLIPGVIALLIGLAIGAFNGGH